MILFPSGQPVDRESFEEYRRAGGYQALAKALSRSPDFVIDTVTESGLTGRGGAGFPAGRKWGITAEDDNLPHYLVCNAGEDEPGSFKDRVLLEFRPHLVLEGMILAAWAIRATEAYLYLNDTYDGAYERMSSAIAEASKARYLGDRILGSDYSLRIRIHRAPTVYVAGEDSAALEVIEGREPKPRQKPPYPAISGLFGKPTVVNNTETIANVPRIIQMGSKWFRNFGVQENPGTMLFCLGEEVNQPGAYELPTGTSLRFLLEVCGGGLKDGKQVKAFLPGGPSCAFLGSEHLDIPMDPFSLKAAGASLGCGVMRFYPEGTCMVEPVLELARFFAAESCGQCPACRMETSMLSVLLARIAQGQGDAALYDQFSKIVDFNRGKGFCALVNMPGPPILSALRLFRQDFDQHLQYGQCVPVQ